MKRFKKYGLKKTPSVDVSKVLLKIGTVGCILSAITAGTAIALPYWVHLTETLETTVAGLTDATDVTYYYGLYSFCLTMKATHLDRNECGDKQFGSLQSWELATLVTLICDIALLMASVFLVILNLCCWNRLVLLVLATIATFLGGFGMIAGVSLYQIQATQQILNIGDLTTLNFKPEFLNLSFWLGFSACISTLVAGTLLMVGTFTWKKPREIHKTRRNQYKTTVRPMRFPQRNRQPAVITVTQM